MSSAFFLWCAARRHALVVWGAMTVWSAVLFAIARSDYVGFRVGRFDLGNMVQAISSTSHGRPLDFTNVWGDQVARLGSHVDPILALFAPLWAIAPSPVTVLLVRIAVVSLGALPVFWLARRHLASERIAVLLALSYLVYPWLSWAALQPNPVTLSIPLFLYCIWALDADRLRVFVPFAVLAAMAGELMGLTLAALGLWYAIARGRRRAGLVIAIVASAWSVFSVYIVVPAFSGGASAYYGYFVAVGRSPQGVIRTLFTDPGAIAAALLTSRDLLYIVALALPLAGLFVLAPGLALVALPQTRRERARRADGDDRSASALHGGCDPDPGGRGRRRDQPAVRPRSGGRGEGDSRPLSSGSRLWSVPGREHRAEPQSGTRSRFRLPMWTRFAAPSRSCRATRL